MILLTSFLISASFTLAWDRAASHLPDTIFKLKYGTQSGVYPNVQSAGTQTTTTVSGLKDYQEYYFIVTATNAAGLESDPSNEVRAHQAGKLNIVKTQEGPNTVMTLSTNAYTGMPFVIEGTDTFASWATVFTGTATSDLISIPFNPSVPYAFYRLKKTPVMMALLESTKGVPSIEYSKPSLGARIKYAFRYRPGHHVDMRKGAELMREKKRLVIIPLPPMPPRFVHD